MQSLEVDLQDQLCLENSGKRDEPENEPGLALPNFESNVSAEL